jgi:hypothetical protein
MSRLTNRLKSKKQLLSQNNSVTVYAHDPTSGSFHEYSQKDQKEGLESYHTLKEAGMTPLLVVSTPQMGGKISRLLLQDKQKMGTH